MDGKQLLTKKGFVFIIVAIIGIFLLYGCIQTNIETGGVIKKNETGKNITDNATNGNLTNITNQTLPKTCEEMTEGKVECLIKRAYDNNNLNDCELIKTTENIENKEINYQNCILKISELNYSYCLNLNESERDSCLRASAEKFGDDACKLINNQSLRSECLLRNYDVECRKINDSYERNICDAIKKKNSSSCELMPSQLQKDECYMNYSLTFMTDECGKISSEGIRTACKSIVLNNLQCGLIELDQVKDYCYKYYAIYSSSCSWCNVIGTVTEKDDCYKRCSIRAQTSSFCNQLSTETNRDNCYWNYAIAKNDVQSCDKIKLIMLKKNCVQNVAKSNLMPSECEILLNTTSLSGKEVADCYLQVIATNNVTFENCMKMNDGYYKDQCIYMAIKRDKLATDYCAYILDSALRKECEKL